MIILSDETRRMGTESTSGGGASSRTPGPDEVYCRDCGSIIKERAEICPECGVRQRSAGLSSIDESGIAAVASLLIPGAGQIFLGHIERGLLFLAALFIAGFMSMFIIGVPLLIAVWLYAIYDAYKLGEDPTRASRVWGAEPGASPITETGSSSDSGHSAPTEREHETPSGRDETERETPTGQTDSVDKPTGETDVTGDRNVTSDSAVTGESSDATVTSETDESGEGADNEERPR